MKRGSRFGVSGCVALAAWLVACGGGEGGAGGDMTFSTGDAPEPVASPGASTSQASGPGGAGGGGGAGASSGGSGGGDPDAPPKGEAALDAWLATGAYKSWNCQPEKHPAGDGSGHSANRICTNDKASGTPSGSEHPEGAAAVKELYSGEEITGYAVSLKTGASSEGGDGWYWYEKIGSSVIADGKGVGLCKNCHAGSPNDFVFVVVE